MNNILEDQIRFQHYGLKKISAVIVVKRGNLDSSSKSHGGRHYTDPYND